MDTINALLHPHHVSLGKNFTSIHMLHQHIDDPYYGLDRHASHKGVSVPRFDIREGPDSFYLEGEIPGFSHLGDISCEFIGNQTLIVRGATHPTPFPGEADLSKEATTSSPWKLKERHVGKFERSFTFSCRIKPSEMKTSLEAGVLSIMMPKDKEGEAKAAAEAEIAEEQR